MRSANAYLRHIGIVCKDPTDYIILKGVIDEIHRKSIPHTQQTAGCAECFFGRMTAHFSGRAI